MCRGGQDKKAWHDSLANTCTLQDALDLATQPEGLLTLNVDGFQLAEEVHGLEKVALLVLKICELKPEEVVADQSKEVKANLARLKTEMLLVRQFLPDAMAAFSEEARDDVVRSIQKKCVKFCRWNLVFKPLYARAEAAKRLE